MCGLSLAQRLERRADLGREQFGLFPRGEVAAPVDLVEVGEGPRPWAGTARNRLLPKLLPCPWSSANTGLHAWNIAPGDSHSWTVLDILPMPTDKRASEPSQSSAVYQAWRIALSKGGWVHDACRVTH